jgi:hypothetical protein
MKTISYPSPVNKLLTFGDYREFNKWPNYLELGLGQEHVGDLIRMASDNELFWADSDSLEVWAPAHAWRALGQLRAEAAIEPLIGMFERLEPSDDWAVSEIPEVLGMIGPAAIPALAAFIFNPVHKMYPRTYAGDSLAAIGNRHPAAREECIRIIVAAVENFEKNEPDLNGFLIANLLDLKAVEAASVMEHAFAANCVDETIAGDWEDVQVKLGLLDARKTERRYSLWDRLFQDGEGKGDEEERVDDKDSVVAPAIISQKNRKKLDAANLKLKNKRAMAKKSRRLNRKKKKKK